MSIQIKQTGLEDYLEGGEAWVKCLMLGAPSAGKTRSASFWPKPIFADCEKGRMSIADRNVPYAEITSSEQMDAFIRHLRIECMKPKDQRKYLTVVVDTLDSYQRIVTAERLTATKKAGLSGYEDWGFLDAKMTSLITSLLNLPMNIVVNVHVKLKEQDGDDDPPILGLKLKGDIKDQAPGDFDLVGFMTMGWEKGEGDENVLMRQVQWHPEPTKPFLKDRSGQLPKFTPVTFTEDDYNQLWIPILELSESLRSGADIETIEMEEPVAPVAPMAGGPVEPKPEPAARATKKAAATPAKKAAAPPAVTPSAPPSAVPPASRSRVEVVETGKPDTPESGADSEPSPTGDAADTPPSVEEPEIELATDVAESPSHDEAVGNVVEGLGGEVVSESEPVEAPKQTAVSTEEEVKPGVPICGTPGKLASGVINPTPKPGCGKTLSGESREVVQVGFVRHRTYLCESCITKANAAAKAAV